MQHDIMKKMVVWTGIFFVASMAVIIYLSASRVVTITDVAQDEVTGEQHGDNAGIAPDGHILTFVLESSNTSYLRIPLPEGCSAQDIIIENHYMDQELCVLINKAEEAFYADCYISGNLDMVKQGTYEGYENGVRIDFQLMGIFEYRTILENNDLYISFLNPKEEYAKIVVIDPACGGMNEGFRAGDLKEKDINLQVAKKLKEKLDKSDIKAYYTRMDDVNPGEESRAQLANATHADMYIRIQTDANEDSSVYGTTVIYNEDYFIPGFGSVELADVLEREVVTSIKGKALGLVKADAQEYAIRNITIPAAAIQVGCITNKQEATLLGREEYLDKVADGIYNAIVKIYEDAN